VHNLEVQREDLDQEVNESGQRKCEKKKECKKVGE
jgi:hypothetical protein